MAKSKYDKLTYTGKLAADKRMAEQVNIDLSQYGNTERPGASYSGKKSWDQLSTDVAEAYNNNINVRQTVQSAQASGNKKAQAIGNISNASEAYDAQRFMEKTHKNRMGNGGAYDGANDQGGVTKYWADKQADKEQSAMDERYDARYATAEKLNSLQDKIKQRAEQTGPTEISSTLTNAQRDIGSFEEDMTSQGANIFGAMGDGNDLEQATEEVMASDTSGDSEDYMTDYKLNVKGGLELSGVETRGPNSGLMRDGSGFQ